MIAVLAFSLIVTVVPLAALGWLALRLDRHWEKVFWLLAVVLACVNYRVWTASRFDDRMGLDVALAIVLTSASLLVFSVPLAVRAVAARKTRSGSVRSAYSAGEAALTRYSNASDWLAAILFAAMLPAIFLIWFGLLARMSGMIAITMVAAIALACAAAHRRLAWPDAFLKRICAVGFLAFVTIGLVTAGTAAAVHRSAVEIAAGRPYCIQSGVEPVRNTLDLSILTLREQPVTQHGGGALYLRNHAILVIDDPDGRRVLNWSYGSWTFKGESRFSSPDISSRPEITCSPQSRGGYTWL